MISAYLSGDVFTGSSSGENNLIWLSGCFNIVSDTHYTYTSDIINHLIAFRFYFMKCATLSRKSKQFLSRWSWNQLRFHGDFSAVFQCKTSVNVYSLNKSCAPTQKWNCCSSKSPCLLSCTSWSNRTKIALKSQLVHTREFQVATSAPQKLH